ncbi:hypothetical protein ACFRFJ_16100 [Streptomyces hydrogenans]|uniref:hypothetical protein n=1 Tax=Streptomyces hydrogenans TaxID=1873719 RepID=UPI0036857816
MAGSFIGVWVGRRQVRDQAKVEHEQWLRGQRQEAFVDFLALWDEAVAQLDERTLNEYEIEILTRRTAGIRRTRSSRSRCTGTGSLWPGQASESP